MNVLICINSRYTRDLQAHFGAPDDDDETDVIDHTDDADDEEELDHENWSDFSGSIVIGALKADSVEAAIQEVAGEYECSTDRLIGFQLDPTIPLNQLWLP